MLGLNVNELLRDVGLDVGALFVLVYLVYFRRHRRWDQLVGLVAFNVCLFTVSAALGASGPVNVGVGFGLFAVLSIVRLRSEEASQVEIGYTMVALVLGLMAGLPGMEIELKGIFSAFLILTMFIVDNQRIDQATRYRMLRIELDRVIHDDEALALHLTQTLNRPVLSTNVRAIDFVRETMLLDVQTGPRKVVTRAYDMFAAIDDHLLTRDTTDLETLRASGDLQERYDTKYVVPAATAVQMVELLNPNWQVLQVANKRSTPYQSSYYDDQDFGLFRDHVQDRRLRYKVRTRRYGNDPEEMLEIKLKNGRGATDKRRILRTVAMGTELTSVERQWISDTLLDAYGRRPLTPLKFTLTLDYTRRTMFNPVSGERLTIDSGVVAEADWGTATPVGDAVVIEVKSVIWSCPTVRQLHHHNIRPLNFSKYCAALSALRPAFDQRARRRAERSLDHYTT